MRGSDVTRLRLSIGAVNDGSVGVEGEGLAVDTTAHSDHHVPEEHASGGDEEERSATESFSDERSGDGDGEVPDLEDTVDEGLVKGGGDADTGKDEVEIVRDEPVAGPLREEPDSDDDAHTAEIGAGVEQLEVRRGFLEGLLDSDSLLDFIVLELDEGVVGVPVRVEPGKDSQSLGIISVTDEESGALGDEPDEEELEDGGEGLQDRGNSPGPVVRDVECPECSPGGDDGAGEPHGVEEGGHGRALGGVGSLRDEERRGELNERGTESDHESSADCEEHIG